MRPIGDTLLLFCLDVCPDGYPAALPLFLSAVLFCLVTVLLSQLPGSACWITLLAGFKAFCTAFVFGVFYVLQQQTDLGPGSVGLFDPYAPAVSRFLLSRISLPRPASERKRPILVSLPCAACSADVWLSAPFILARERAV